MTPGELLHRLGHHMIRWQLHLRHSACFHFPAGKRTRTVLPDLIGGRTRFPRLYLRWRSFRARSLLASLATLNPGVKIAPGVGSKVLQRRPKKRWEESDVILQAVIAQHLGVCNETCTGVNFKTYEISTFHLERHEVRVNSGWLKLWRLEKQEIRPSQTLPRPTRRFWSLKRSGTSLQSDFPFHTWYTSSSNHVVL